MERTLLTIGQHAELVAVMRKRHGSAASGCRARCVGLRSDGERRVDSRSKLACNDRVRLEAADVIGPYLDPPAHAVVFCVDEETATQALDRNDRMLPLSPGRARRPGFEYKRNDTLNLFATLNTTTGEVLGKTATRHTRDKFVAFLEDIVASQPRRREIHVICDNVSSHETPRVQAFLAKHRRVHVHCTPTYCSWLNQVENWFARIQRDVVTRGVFTPIKDLDKKFMRYIRQHNKDPRTIEVVIH